MSLHAKVGVQLQDEVCLLRGHDQGAISVANARHEARFSDVQMLEIMCSEGSAASSQCRSLRPGAFQGKHPLEARSTSLPATRISWVLVKGFNLSYHNRDS